MAAPDISTGAASNTVHEAKKFSPEQLDEYADDSCFNQIFSLPADPARGRLDPLQISYADFGFHRSKNNSSGDENSTEVERVLLFFGPLVSSRLHNIAKDALAKRYSVRVISAERPGIGKTSSVPAERLLETWREAMASLLTHLRIKSVSLASHSGGTIFCLDFALHNPNLLLRPSGRSPAYIALAAPWVHPSHSGMLALSLASALPRALVAQTGRLATFANATLGPVVNASAAVVSSSVPKGWSSATKKAGREGEDVLFEEALRERVAERIVKGGVMGIGQEVQVLLRNGVEKDGWSDWGDVDQLVPRLGEAVVGAGAVDLKIDVFFAEKDHMIGDAGEKGSRWFESCWRDVDGVDFTSEVVKGSDHDCVWDLRWDVMEKVFKAMTQDA